jgi:DNA-binding NtrC family response regulator
VKKQNRILVIDDEPTVTDGLRLYLGESGYRVETASTGGEGLRLFENRGFDLVITDLQLPDMQGFDVLRGIKTLDSDVEIIMITGYGSVDRAIEAVKEGAFYFVEKPFEPDELRMLVERALDRRALTADVRRLEGERKRRDVYFNIVGRAKAMQDIFEMIESVAKSDANILITGESGTGKEMIANAIHENSLRAKANFIKVNCAALPKELIESELFGHTKGAFTGAQRDKEGFIGAADGGSLLLDEIAEMPIELQPKLLRVLQERQYNRLGSEKPTKVDFRLISSTNRNPEEAIREYLLREDLYYRISTITIDVPPLRERTEDIALIAHHFVTKYGERYNKPVEGFAPDAMDKMMSYRWPGNVRELENVIERAVLLSRGTSIEAANLPFATERTMRAVAAVATPAPLSAEAPAEPHEAAPDAPDDRAAAPPAIVAPPPLVPTPHGEPREHESAASDDGFVVPSGLTLEEIERSVIYQTLKRTKGNKQAAANALGIYRPRLYSKIKKYNMTEFM